ncbi:MAG TPA: MFS transporter [Gaiellaceae bacterium]|nr:MFS transporter [Gaiellaceae bacterium]
MRASLTAFRRVFTNRDLRRLQLAWAGSNIGAWAYTVAIAVYAFQQDGAYAVGLIGLARWIAAGAASPFTGALGDRFPRVRVMVSADLLRAALLGAMALIVAADGSPLAVYVISIVGTVIGTAFRPAQAALVPGLAKTPEELTAANVAASTIESVGIFVGPALGGILVATSGVEATFAAASGFLLWSAALIGRVDESAHRREAEEEAGEEEPSVGFLRETSEGFRAIVADRRLTVLTGLFAAQTFVDGALGVLVVVLALETLDLGASGVGYLNSVLGVGGIIGGIAAAALVARARLGTDFGVGIVLWGMPLLLIGIWPEPLVAIVALTIVGVGNTIVDVSGDTLLQRAVPDEVLARAFAAMESVILVAVALGSVAAPVLVDLAGDRWALVVVGAILPVLAVFSWGSLSRMDETKPAPEIELLRSLPLFAPLPPPTLEYLAGRFVRRRVAAGETIVTRGDRGDRFFVIVEGTVDVASDDGAPRRLGPGEFFGEIALLRDVPRTATVVAATDVELLELPGEEFVAAVTGNAEALRAADAVVGARLGMHRGVLPV